MRAARASLDRVSLAPPKLRKNDSDIFYSEVMSNEYKAHQNAILHQHSRSMILHFAVKVSKSVAPVYHPNVAL
jgi:hypothetical protein